MHEKSVKRRSNILRSEDIAGLVLQKKSEPSTGFLAMVEHAGCWESLTFNICRYRQCKYLHNVCLEVRLAAS
jgi:hypothetical protein